MSPHTNRFWAHTPLSVRLLIITSLTLLAAGLLMLYSTVRQEGMEARHDMARRLREELQILPASLAETIVIGDYATLQQSIDHLAVSRMIDRIRFTDSNGAEVHTSDVEAPAHVPTWFARWLDLHDTGGDAPVVIGGHLYGTIHLAITAQVAIDRLWRHFLLQLLVLSLALGLDFVAIWLVLRNALRPLGALNVAATALARGDLTARVRSEGSPELIASLDTFNAMAKAVEEARYHLTLEKERLQVTLASIGDAVITTDRAGRVEYLNELAEQLTGWPVGQAQGRPLPEVFNIIDEVTRRVAENPLDQVFREGRIVELVNRTLLISLEGSERPIADSAAPIRAGRDGEILGAVLVFRDQSEERARYDQMRLSESVFQHAQEGIMITDADAIIVSVNPAFTELTGYAADEAIGRRPSLLASGLHPREFFTGMWASLLETGQWRGELWNRRKNGELFAEQLAITAVPTEEGGRDHFVGVFSDITALKSQQQYLERIAHYDALTQLPNRVLLADRLQMGLAQARRLDKMLAVCYLDLDGFKPVNDQFGHEAGDELLVEIAGRLTMALRAGDTVARLGGDEFVMLLDNISDVDECQRMLDRILKVVAKPHGIGGSQTTEVSASIGVTLFPLDDTDPETLLRHADQAMYAAKESGRNRYHLFDPEYDRRTRAHREAVNRIKEALDQGEFVLHYQPKVDMRRGRVVGAEALICWQHPLHGLLPPSEFLPYVENSELSSRLDEWVMGQALAQMDEWRRGGLRLPVSVNISARHLQRDDMSARLAQLLSRYPEVAAKDFELEILETTALDDILHVNTLIEGCRRLGVHFTLDDFGTGYSSLSYLKRLPAETIKIDQSFVRDMLRDTEDMAIVEGVIGLAEAFQRKVIAEGVETIVHGIVLLHLGCDLAQGYGIARPMFPAEIPDWVASWRPDPRWAEALTSKWNRRDLPLLVAEFDHWAWLEALSEWLAGAADRTRPRPKLDEGNCPFVRWLNGPGMQQYGDLPLFGSIRNLRRRLQMLALDMVDQYYADNIDPAREQMSEIERISEQMLGLLRQLPRSQD